MTTPAHTRRRFWLIAAVLTVCAWGAASSRAATPTPKPPPLTATPPNAAATAFRVAAAPASPADANVPGTNPTYPRATAFQTPEPTSYPPSASGSFDWTGASIMMILALGNVAAWGWLFRLGSHFGGISKMPRPWGRVRRTASAEQVGPLASYVAEFGHFAG